MEITLVIHCKLYFYFIKQIKSCTKNCTYIKMKLRGDSMISVNYSEARKNFKEYLDKTIDNCEPIIITRKEERNVVMISLDEYNNLKENEFIMKDTDYYQELIRRSKKINVSGIEHEVIDEENMGR